MELNNISKKGLGTSKNVFCCLICIITGNNNTSDNVLPVTTKPAIMGACAETVAKPSACLHLKMNQKQKNHYMNVNSNPTAYQQAKSSCLKNNFSIYHVSTTPVINLYF
jgi:hypothetical protein